MIYQDDITTLQTNIKEIVGQKIKVKGSLGRSRLFEKAATLEKAYPNIFVVKYEENERNVSYQYKDILTRTVEVEVFDGENYNSIMPPAVDEKKKKKKDITQML